MKKLSMSTLTAVVALSVGCGQKTLAPTTAPLAVVPFGERPGIRLQSIFQSPRIDWNQQLGTPGEINGVSVDSHRNTYVVGNVWGNGELPGQTTSEGGGDAFVRKYDATGNEVWTHQFGTLRGESHSLGVALDSRGNVYMLGETYGRLPGPVSGSGSRYSTFLRKYDADGNELWTRQFTIMGWLSSSGIAVDVSGNAYVVGYSDNALPDQIGFDNGGAFVRKYDASGNELWTRQFGTSDDDRATGVAVDSNGNAYVTGYVSVALAGQTSLGGGSDAFVRKYDATGNVIWTRQFGTSGYDQAYGVAVDSNGNAFVTANSRSVTSSHAFVTKFDASGHEVWIKQFGTSSRANGVTVDSNGSAFVALSGQLGGNSEVRKFDSSGNLAWSHLFGTSRLDTAKAVSTDANGDAYVSGALQGANSDQRNQTIPFVARLTTNTPPVLICPDLTIEASGATGAIVPFSPTATDPDGDAVTVSTTPPSGSPFPLGTSTVSAVAVDSRGGVTTAYFNVIVRDTNPPLVTNPAEVVVTTDNPNGTSVGLPSINTFTVTDLVDPYPTLAYGSVPSSFPVGTTAVAFTATDYSGNRAQGHFNVSVKLVAPLDILPGTFPNSIDRQSKWNINFAILSTAQFDAAQIDPRTVTIAGTQAKRCPLEDVNGDGRRDLVMHCLTQDLRLALTDVEAMLQGKTYSGIAFEAKDSIRVVR